MSRSTSDAFSERIIKAYASRHFNQPVTEGRIEKLAGDASTRQYYRIRLPENRSYVVARYPEPIDPTHSTCQITRLFLEAGLPVPRILDVQGSEGLMLLDDLGDLRLQEWLDSADDQARRERYREAIDLIIHIQEATALAIELDSVAAHLAFDEEKLEWELRFFYENFFNRYLGRAIDPVIQSEIFAEFTSLARALASLPRVLCHRDYHARNLMLHEDRLFIIDHQDARMGPVSYDLASLLGDPYVELSEDFRQEMYNHFVARRRERGEWLFDETWQAGFEQEYQLMAIQRLLKATGTYTYQMAVMGNDVYLPYIPRALRGALAAMRHLDRFSAIRAALEQR